jgi:hypothetical protein
MPLITSAQNGLTIRLTEERWQHITAGHPEAEEDGFVITAYLTKRINSLNKRKEVWSRSP